MQDLSKKSVIIWAWVYVEARELVEKLAELKSVSISEYVRSLVLGDLDKRSLFMMRLKGESTSASAPMRPKSREGKSRSLLNEAFLALEIRLHIAKRQFRHRKICGNHSFAIHFWYVLGGLATG